MGPQLLQVEEDRCWEEVARDWVARAPVGAALGQAIAESPWPALFWECAPVSRATQDTPFACVLAEAHGLAEGLPDPSPFQGQLPGPVNTFWNLGHDAVLIAPAPPGPFGHLSAFCRNAPSHLQASFWKAVGQGILDWWARTPEPLWLNTSGLGVAWLHARLDQRPKYYTHAPYRSGSTSQPITRTR